MNILGIDPGCTESAYVSWNGERVIEHGKIPNEQLLYKLGFGHSAAAVADAAPVVVIEMVASYGMSVGKEVFETVRWIGRFEQAWRERGGEVQLVYRKEIKLHHCETARANDSNIRTALIDRFGPPGTKKQPGSVTYGLTKDRWAALALATYYWDTRINSSSREAPAP